MAEIRRRIKRSQAQEHRTAERYRGSRQAGSGSGWVRKNDVRSEDFLIENKRTDNRKTITLKADDLLALRNKAALEGRTGLLQFDLAGERWVVLHEDDFPA